MSPPSPPPAPLLGRLPESKEDHRRQPHKMNDSLGVNTSLLDDSIMPIPLVNSPLGESRDLGELHSLINRNVDLEMLKNEEFIERRKQLGTLILTCMWLGVGCAILTYIYGHHSFREWLKNCDKTSNPLDSLTCFQSEMFHVALSTKSGRLVLNLLLNLWTSWIVWAGIHACKSHAGYGGALFLSACIALGQLYGMGTVVPLIWCSMYIWTLGNGVGLHDRQVWISSSASLVTFATCSAFLVVGKHGSVDKALFWYLILPPLLPLIWALALHLPHTSHTVQMLGARAARIIHLLYAGMFLAWHLQTLVQFIRHPASEHGGHVVENLFWIQLFFLWTCLLLCIFYESGLAECIKTVFIGFVFGPGAALQSWRWLQETEIQRGLEKVLGRQSTFAQV